MENAILIKISLITLARGLKIRLDKFYYSQQANISW